LNRDQQEILLYIEDPKSLSYSSPISRSRGKFILDQYSDLHSPLRFFLRSTHDYVSVFEWIVCRKLLLQRVSRAEKNLFYLLGTKRDELHSIATQAVRFEKLVYGENLTSTLERMKFQLSFYQPKRKVNSFKPLFTAHKEYIVQRVEPKRFVGVGYKDQGSISTSPSWKEQVISDGEEPLQKIEKLADLLTYISLLVSELEFPDKVLPAEESKKGRKGQTSARIQLTQWNDLDLHFGGRKG